MSPNSLTPVQQVHGLYIKRDDLYQPFGPGEVNGGKLRQCMLLVDKIHQSYEGLVTCCSIHSPQAPITAACAKAYGMRCECLYGGTKADTLRKLPMPRLALKYGAELTIAAKSGRHSILYSIAKNKLQRVKDNKDYIILYGINLTEHEDVMLGAISNQCENLPDRTQNLVITCGSGITAIGVMLGLKKFGKRVESVHLVATAPDRRPLIHNTLRRLDADREFHYHDLFHTPGFSYEAPAHSVWGGIKLHPQYEAKTMAWFANSGLDPERTLFWITGAQPTAIK